MTFNLQDKTHILLDCDGVIWKGSKAISGAKEALDNLQSLGYQLGFVTNNSSLSREMFSQKFVSLGFESEKYVIVNSGFGAAIYLRENNLSKVFMIGEEGLLKELLHQGLSVEEVYRPDIEAVCIGWDRKLTWSKLADAMWVILNNDGRFIGTNPDNSFPSADRLVPGAGAGIAALANACGKDPDIIIGKPNPYLLNLCLKKMNCTDSAKAVFIGDRLSTDIKAGIDANMDTILVQTGISDQHLKKTILPTYTLESLAQIDQLI